MVDDDGFHIGFLLFPGFPTACLTSMVEPLRAANGITGHEAFCWTPSAEEPGRVTASAEVGAALADAPPTIAHYRTAFGRTPAQDRLRVNRFRVEENVPVSTI